MIKWIKSIWEKLFAKKEEVEEVVCVFSTPSTTIFNVPITCLYLPVRNFVLHCK